MVTILYSTPGWTGIKIHGEHITYVFSEDHKSTISVLTPSILVQKLNQLLFAIKPFGYMVQILPDDILEQFWELYLPITSSTVMNVSPERGPIKKREFVFQLHTIVALWSAYENVTHQLPLTDSHFTLISIAQEYCESYGLVTPKFMMTDGRYEEQISTNCLYCAIVYALLHHISIKYDSVKINSNFRRCVNCNQIFVFEGKRRKYCPSCIPEPKFANAVKQQKYRNTHKKKS